MVKFIALALLVLAGHIGWWVFCYNRLNASALPRRLIKGLELLIVAATLAIPIIIAVTHWQLLRVWLEGESAGQASPLFWLWSLWSIGCALLLGPGWLESRLWLWPPANMLQHEEERTDVAREVSQPVTGKWLTRSLQHLPLNEITQLSITRKTIQLERGLATGWQSLRIGHLSDLHFTGGLTPAFYHYVVERMQRLAPDLIAVTGDIVDEDECLEWIQLILGRLDAPLGCHFLFGNHERRLEHPEAAAQRLRALGWRDLGVEDVVVEPGRAPHSLPGRPRLILCGNERPWFERHVGDHWAKGPLGSPAADSAVKIALAHTPDQCLWARELGMDLMLAGHTHGGQVRIPGIGPLISPSRYGSRFASGVFRLPPMVMHVSRGLSGTQPLRWRCTPEISLLTIVPATSPSAQRVQTEARRAPTGEPSRAL